MGRSRAPKLPCFRLRLFIFFVVCALRCDGGVTSRYVRKLEATVDMPLDSDVFRVPPGYNAPQQAQRPRVLIVTRPNQPRATSNPTSRHLERDSA